MRLTDTRERYGFVAIVNHWVLAATVFGLVVSGVVAAELAGDAARGAILGPHKAVGVLVLAGVAWLALWQAVQPRRPGAVPGTTAGAAFLRRAMHVFLIAGTIALSLSGIVMAVFKGRTVEVFGLFTIPAQAELAWLAGPAHEVHVIGGWLMLFAILGHGAVAALHHLINRDATLLRMLGRSA